MLAVSAIVLIVAAATTVFSLRDRTDAPSTTRSTSATTSSTFIEPATTTTDLAGIPPPASASATTVEATTTTVTTLSTTTTSTTTTTTSMTTTTTSTTTTTTPPIATLACQDEGSNFQLEYPAGWYTEDEHPDWTCSLFDPQPIELIPDTELPGFAITIFDLPGSFSDNQTIVTEPDAALVLQIIEIEIAGRPTVCANTLSTGEGYYDADTEILSCAIDWGQNTLLIESVAWPWVDVDANLDAMDVILASIEPITPLAPVG